MSEYEYVIIGYFQHMEHGILALLYLHLLHSWSTRFERQLVQLSYRTDLP
jgi:hypothetical protein